MEAIIVNLREIVFARERILERAEQAGESADDLDLKRIALAEASIDLLREQQRK